MMKLICPATLLAWCALAGPALAVTFNVFTNPHPTLGPGTIGFAFAGNKFVGSVQQDGTGALYSTDLNGGNVQVFAPTVNLAGSDSSEHYVSSSLGLGGFPSRDIYVAAANTVVHISNDGSASNTFVSGLVGNVRGISFDSVGTFGHDMLVTTDVGSVYRVDSAGSPSLLASTGEDTEGLDVAPLGAGFGGFDGQLIVGSEGSGSVRAINTAGAISLVALVASAEEVNFVPVNLGASGSSVEGFYGADYTPDVIKANASEFAGMQGDLIVTGETTHFVNRVHWNGAGFDVTQIGQFFNQPEDGLFVTTDIIKSPEPTSLALALLGGAAVAIVAVRKKRYDPGLPLRQ
jgi:hypothetical protein